MDARSRGFEADARSPALSSGAGSRSLKELQPPTLGGSPTRRAKTEGTAVVSEGCSSWRISSRAARTSLTTPQRAYSLPRRPSLNPKLVKVPHTAYRKQFQEKQDQLREWQEVQKRPLEKKREAERQHLHRQQELLEPQGIESMPSEMTAAATEPSPEVLVQKHPPQQSRHQ